MRNIDVRLKVAAHVVSVDVICDLESDATDIAEEISRGLCQGVIAIDFRSRPYAILEEK